MAKQQEAKTEKLKFTEYLGFGLSAVPGAMNTIIAAFLTMFYTDNVGLAAGAVGTMLLISKLMDGISDLVAGSIIDKTRTRWGKARPWLLWTAVPMGISIALIFFVPAQGSDIGRLIYAFLTYNLFSTVMYTIAGIAGNALMPLMTQDGKSRGTLASLVMLFGLGGTMLGMSITFPFISAMGGDLRAWRIVFCVYGIVVTLSMLAGFLMVREHVTPAESGEGKEQEKISFREGMGLFFRNKYFRFALFAILSLNLSLNLNSGSQTYFYTYAMNDAMLTTKLNLLSLVPTIFSIMFLAPISLRVLGKKKSVYVGAAGQILGYVLRGLAVPTGSFALIAVGTVLSGLFTGPISIPINVLTADAVDYGEYMSGKRIEGIGSAVVSFSQKVTAGIASGLVGWVLQATGYVANQVQSSSVIAGISTLFAWAPMAFLILIGVGYIIWYHYDEEEPGVMAELNRRRAEAAKS